MFTFAPILSCTSLSPISYFHGVTSFFRMAKIIQLALYTAPAAIFHQKYCQRFNFFPLLRTVLIEMSDGQILILTQQRITSSFFFSRGWVSEWAERCSNVMTPTTQFISAALFTKQFLVNSILISFFWYDIALFTGCFDMLLSNWKLFCIFFLRLQEESDINYAEIFDVEVCHQRTK